MACLRQLLPSKNVAPSVITTPVAPLLTGMAPRPMDSVVGCTDHGQLDPLDLRLECNTISSPEHAVSGFIDIRTITVYFLTVPVYCDHFLVLRTEILEKLT